jgi:hypothetical protein
MKYCDDTLMRDDKYFITAMKYLYRKHPRRARAVYLRLTYNLTFKEIAEELDCGGLKSAILHYKRGISMLRFMVMRKMIERGLV